MKRSLAWQFKSNIDSRLLVLESLGLTYEIFDALEQKERGSFGIYVEYGVRGFYLTAWNPGEVQRSIIDYDADSLPREKYFPGVEIGWLGMEFERLVDWVRGRGD
ncbi:hypothetical protein [Amycolatopsis magusensis]|uniref:hypothetical protein n=1 Tax=Amycolatopsis magusensis TaxID=882444 RepID=UPI0024A9F314|nr:hypothetical protein [Amycolatopsis magusensis]MDI5974643.1 hypothetical protein [Amycolatopsis magusensis]